MGGYIFKKVIPMLPPDFYNHLVSAIAKRGLLDDYIKFTRELITRYEKGHTTFKYRSFSFHPRQYGSFITLLAKAGIIEKINSSPYKNVWCIKNMEAIKKLYEKLVNCQNNGGNIPCINECMLNDMQRNMYIVGRLIAEKEGGNVIEVILRILTDYYITHYGEDENIRGIKETIELIEKLGNFYRGKEEKEAGIRKLDEFLCGDKDEV